MVRASARGPRRTAVLLCGPQGGGKTTLLYALRGTPLPQGSVTSMQATSLTFAVPLAHVSAPFCTVHCTIMYDRACTIGLDLWMIYPINETFFTLDGEYRLRNLPFSHATCVILRINN